MTERIVVGGGCHCGAVRFEAEIPTDVVAYDCNCSICSRAGFQHLFVTQEEFTLLRGDDALQTYTFGSGIAQHRFCRICGIKSFYVPRSHPDGFSLNVRCLDQEALGRVTIRPFDGRNWERNVASLHAGDVAD